MYKIDSYSFKDKKTLIRVDFNVPLNDNLEVTDSTRIKAAIPTIKKVLNDGGIPILMSHLGRPKGEYKENMSIKHIVPAVEKELGRKVKFIDSKTVINDDVKQAAKTLKSGDVLILENLRFCKGETKGDVEFAKELASLADCYIMDAFGTAHREHASTATIAQFFPNDKMFGYLVENELASIDKALKNGEKPFTAIIGGSKVSTKINIIESLLEKVDNLIIGGGIAFTITKALGGNIGNSLVENDFIDTALQIVKKAKEKNVNLYIPKDSIIADKFDNDASIKHSDVNNIPDGWMGLDIGIKTGNEFTKVIEESATILWNGPIGVFEMPSFETGTLRIAMAVAKATSKGAYSMIGGGDSVAAINKFDLADKVSYISTAGGALLEYIEGKELPGIKAIRG